jgi:hypothetical protein
MIVPSKKLVIVRTGDGKFYPTVDGAPIEGCVSTFMRSDPESNFVSLIFEPKAVQLATEPDPTETRH